MLSLELEFISSKMEDEINSFTAGHMTISGLSRLVTSKGKQPDQAMMIFPSIVELLDGIRYWMLASRTPVYSFYAIDSSFQFTLRKEREESVKFIYEKEALGTVSKAELLQAVWSGVDSFVSRYGRYLTSADPVFEDLQDALKAFKDMLTDLGVEM